MTLDTGRQRIAVAICTYRRNEALTTLLDALKVCVLRVSQSAAVGVVVVDDTSEGLARVVAEKFEGAFELGITYLISGRQNISAARNMAIKEAKEVGDWIAMTDDDCEPVPEWLKELLDTQLRTGADAVSGPLIRRVPPGSPRWLIEEPFLELGLDRPAGDSVLAVAGTHNSMISSRWLKENPTIEFRPDLGVIGGEDMVFYNTAYRAGLRIRHAERAVVYENEPQSRATLAYQLRLFFWVGNSSYVTNVRNGIRPSRMLLNGVNDMRHALARPFVLVCRGKTPQLRYCLASALYALGKLVGPLGVRVRHR